MAGVDLSAGIPVVAGAAVGLRRVRARPRGWITGAGNVALVGGGAGDGVAARAHAALAGVGLGARVAVVAAGAIVLLRGLAHAAAGVASRPITGPAQAPAEGPAGRPAGVVVAGP